MNAGKIKKMFLPQMSSFTQTKIYLHHYDIPYVYISGNVHVFDIIIILLLVVLQAVELDMYMCLGAKPFESFSQCLKALLSFRCSS